MILGTGIGTTGVGVPEDEEFVFDYPPGYGEPGGGLEPGGGPTGLPIEGSKVPYVEEFTMIAAATEEFEMIE